MVRMVSSENGEEVVSAADENVFQYPFFSRPLRLSFHFSIIPSSD